MANILIISGSVYGTATLVAEDLQLALEKNGHTASHQNGGNSKALTQAQLDLLLVCTSTTGAGDVPSNLEVFYSELVDAPPRITDLKYAVIALGDSSYGETYCGAGLSIDKALADIGAIRLIEPLQLDALETSSPEDDAIDWVDDLINSKLA
jgi:flavodoxin